MKKNLLFVMPSLSAGGGEKSLVNLLSQIDYDLFDVDLFLLNQEGIFMDYIPREVNVLRLPNNFSLFRLPLLKSIGKYITRGKYSLAYNRLMFSISNRITNSTSIKEQKSWRYMSPSFDRLEKDYDAAIGFLEKSSTYFCVEKTNAIRKIGWVHIDYDELGMDPEFDISYFKKLSHIVTVSEECAKVLKKRFPTEKDKVEVIYNIVSPKMIYKMADEGQFDAFERKGQEINILSVGRLHHQKGFELAIESCKKLIEKGYNIKWNIIGEGEERGKLTNLITRYQLEGRFNLLGLRSNPYPYIKQADIYAQTSRFEGKSIAIDEAKILKKPIIVTDFSTARDQINHEVNGLVVDMNSEAIVSGLEKLINNAELRDSFVENLANEELGTEEEITKVYTLIGGIG
jgi:glycosyltransferase involved in cell wall biosynthesis